MRVLQKALEYEESPTVTHQTPQVPPCPMVTWSPFTMTGTSLTPPESLSISSRLRLSALISTYSASSPYADLALLV